MPTHQPRDRPPGFVALNWENCPPPDAQCETHNFKADGSDAIVETVGIVLNKYLVTYGEGLPVWFRVVG